MKLKDSKQNYHIILCPGINIMFVQNLKGQSKKNVHYKIMPCTRIAMFTSIGWYERHYMSMSGIQPSQSKNQQTNNSKNNSNNINSKMKQKQSQKSDN